MNFTKKLICVMLAALTLFACACTVEGTPTDPSATIHVGIDVNEDYAHEYKSVFYGSEIETVKITIPEADLAAIYAAPDAEEFYSADFSMADETVSNIGFRTAGNTDLSDFDASAQNRYSFKIKFDKFVDKQKYLKLDEMYLINLRKDPSYMREYLAFQAFVELGSAASLVTYCKLYINNEYKGLYLAVEAVDDAFLKRNFGNNDGTLYKSAGKASLLDEESLGLLDQKNGQDQSKEDLKNLITVLNAMPEGEKGSIETVLDVDSVLKYVAVCTGLGAYSSYIGKSADNYFLACNGGKFTIIPWDLKSAFGGAGKDQGSSIEIDPSNPVYRVDISERPLVEKLLAVDEYYKKYETYLKKVNDYLGKIDSLIEAADKMIASEVAADTTAFYDETQYKISIGLDTESVNTTGIITLKEYAEKRHAYLNGIL